MVPLLMPSLSGSPIGEISLSDLLTDHYVRVTREFPGGT
jgi:hypothetical protein